MRLLDLVPAVPKRRRNQVNLRAIEDFQDGVDVAVLNPGMLPGVAMKQTQGVLDGFFTSSNKVRAVFLIFERRRVVNVTGYTLKISCCQCALSRTLVLCCRWGGTRQKMTRASDCLCQSIHDTLAHMACPSARSLVRRSLLRCAR